MQLWQNKITTFDRNTVKTNRWNEKLLFMLPKWLNPMRSKIKCICIKCARPIQFWRKLHSKCSYFFIWQHGLSTVHGWKCWPSRRRIKHLLSFCRNCMLTVAFEKLGEMTVQMNKQYFCAVPVLVNALQTNSNAIVGITVWLWQNPMINSNFISIFVRQTLLGALGEGTYIWTHIWIYL